MAHRAIVVVYFYRAFYAKFTPVCYRKRSSPYARLVSLPILWAEMALCMECGSNSLNMECAVRLFLAAILTAYLSFVTVALAQNADEPFEHIWTVGKVTGTAWIISENQEKIQVEENHRFGPGQTLITSSRTRVQLKRKDERIQVGSGSTLSLPLAETLEAGKTVITQKRGTLHLVVSKRDAPHFSVQTPFMVAAVKGTQFTVSIGASSTEVRVQEGSVEVKNKYADQIEYVGAGQAVAMNIAQLSDVSGASPTNAVVRMVFLDRDDVFPDSVDQPTRERGNMQEWENQDRGGGLMGFLAGVASQGMMYAKYGVDGVINATLAVLQPILEFFGAKIEYDGLRRWVGLIFAAVAVGLVIGFGAAYIAVRRKGA